ncbi:hypothetical protein NEOLEDRAFT_1050794, partial [Neolentinus lepideus HHB14362 ss-1]
MGHIALEIARCLVEKGFMTGVALDNSLDESLFCESCVKEKVTQKPVPKCADKFGDEIHTDVWGPAPVQTLCGHCYYITYTDD